MKQPLIVVISLHFYWVSYKLQLLQLHKHGIMLVSGSCLMDVTHFLYINKFSKLKILIQKSRSQNTIGRKALFYTTLSLWLFLFTCFKGMPRIFYKCLCLCLTYLLVLVVEEWYWLFNFSCLHFQNNETMKTYHWP